MKKKLLIVLNVFLMVFGMVFSSPRAINAAESKVTGDSSLATDAINGGFRTLTTVPRYPGDSFVMFSEYTKSDKSTYGTYNTNLTTVYDLQVQTWCQCYDTVTCGDACAKTILYYLDNSSVDITKPEPHMPCTIDKIKTKILEGYDCTKGFYSKKNIDRNNSSKLLNVLNSSLKNGFPVVVLLEMNANLKFNWGSGSGHFVVISGLYKKTGTNEYWIKVNDPYGYHAGKYRKSNYSLAPYGVAYVPLETLNTYVRMDDVAGVTIETALSYNNTNKYTIVLDYQFDSKIEYKHYSKTQDATYVTPTTVKPGNTFLGWYTEKIGGTEVTQDDWSSIKSDTVLYAHWKQRDGSSYTTDVELAAKLDTVFAYEGIKWTLVDGYDTTASDIDYNFTRKVFHTLWGVKNLTENGVAGQYDFVEIFSQNQIKQTKSDTSAMAERIHAYLSQNNTVGAQIRIGYTRSYIVLKVNDTSFTALYLNNNNIVTVSDISYADFAGYIVNAYDKYNSAGDVNVFLHIACAANTECIHTYAFDSFVWDEYTAKAKYVCSRNSAHVVEYDATVTSQVTLAPTCVATGTKVYTATYDGHSDTKNQTLEIDPNNHELIHHAYVAPTLTTKGSIEYWECSRCQKLFSDSNATIEITLEDTVIDEGTIPTSLSAPTIATEIDSKSSIAILLDSDDNNIHYDIYRATSKKGKYKKIGSTQDDVYIDTKASYGTTYYYKAMAVYNGYSIIKSPYSKIVSGKIALAKPTASVSVENGVQINISWNENPIAEGYQVYYSTSKKGTYKKLATVKNDTEYTWNKAASNKTYYFKVRSYVKIGKKTKYSSYSTYKGAKVTISTPKITSAYGRIDSISLWWTGDEKTTEYTIYRSTSKTKNFKAIDVVSGTGNDACLYVDDNIKYGKTYYYKVRANVKCDGYDHLSSYSSVKSSKAILNPPGYFAAIPGYDGIILEWESYDPESDCMYFIERATNSKFTKNLHFIAVSEDGYDYVSYEDTSVEDGVTYYYRLATCIGDYVSAYTPVIKMKFEAFEPDWE